MHRSRPASILAATVAAALALTGAVAAYAARSLSVNDTAHLRLLKAVGSLLVEQGAASGTLPGAANVRMTVGSSVTATFSIAASGGTIYGRGVAALHSTSRYASFGGSLTVTRGTGRYAHARGSGNLYGVIDRRTDAVTVQTIGTLRY